MKTKKGGNISWLYIAIILLALLAFAVLLGFNTAIGNKIKSLLFGSIGTWFG